MAIFPFSNAYVINKDVVVDSSFKAGMILMTNSSGNVVPADSQLLVTKNLAEKQSAIIGIAAGDSNITGNTIIVPDYIGSNYLDSNSNFVSISDREYVSVRRQLLDYADETVNDYYNINYSPKPKRTGIGIYSLSGDTFATDQFNPVMHGDYGLDSTILQTLSPGDLLTIGGGINAGKLIKVNPNSIGPGVPIIGIVDRYNSSTGLLYFQQIDSSVSFGTNNLTLFYDFSNPASYTSGTTVIDLSPNSKNGTLQNGPVYTNAGSASYLTFDNSDDVIETNTNANGFGIYNKSFTLVAVCRPSVIGGDKMIFGNLGGFGGQDMLHAGFRGNAIHFGFFGADSTWNYGVVPNQIYYIVWRWNVGNTAYIFANGTQVVSSFTQPSYQGFTNIGISRSFDRDNGAFGGRIYMTRIYNRALTDTEVLNIYNFEKTRFGL
jgi:hypothetical protein